MRTGFIFPLALCGLLAIQASLLADDFTGKYKGQTLSVELSPDAGALGGTIQLGDQKFPLKAHADGANLQGTFTGGGNEFSFTATLAGDTLTLATGGATYALKKDVPVNPLAAAAPVNPLAVANAGDAPSGYTVVTTTDSGKAFSVKKPAADSVMSAMKSTFPDLEKYFGSRPDILGAYEDLKNHKSGTATFTVDSKGRKLKGLVSCKLDDHGATVAVIYCSADAPPAEWAKLSGTGSSDAPPPAAAPPQLTAYSFPDGTGTIGLADGWTTPAQSCMQPVQIKGPADQVITIGLCASVQTPDSPMMQMQRQLEANARQWGMQPPAPPKVLVGPDDGPVDAMTNLVPQFSRMNEESGSFAIEIDNLKELPQKAAPSLPNGKVALVSYGVTHIEHGNRKHFLAGARVETTPIGNGSWMFYMTEIAGPDATFAGDTPLMLAIINSLKVNNEVVAEKTHQNIDASNRRFTEMQQAHKQQMAGYDEQNKAWERRSLETSRSNADFDEVIRGDRTVLDTQSGERTSVDLGNVDGIVNKLNEGDPGRYQQIPLRDEMYPVPGH